MSKAINGYEKTARCNACLKQVMDNEFEKPKVNHSRGFK
jgi:hypothetical protein